MPDSSEITIPLVIDDVVTQPVLTGRPILIVDDVPANIVAASNGRGTGSTFEITLPLAVSAELVVARARSDVRARTGDVQRTKEAGFHAHLVKPASAAAILAALTPSLPGD